MIVVVAESLILLITFFTGKKKDETDEQIAANEENSLNRKGGMRALSVLVAVVAVVAFFLTENITLPMALVDKWTLLMLVIAIIDTAIMFLSKKSNETETVSDR